MPVEIFIDENRMDTDASTTISETKQVNDFFEIGNGQTSYTNSFKIPKSERNKMLLGMMGFAGHTSLAAYRIHKVSVYRDGIQTIADGIGYFKETSDKYSVYVYSENIDLFDTIASKSLADLNTTSLNHILNVSNWVASFVRKDYTYAIADYGKTEGETIEVNYQLPCLYVSYLGNKIVNEAGYKWKYVGRGGRNDYNPFINSDWSQLAITIDEGFEAEKESVNPIKKMTISKDKTSQFNTSTINTLGNSVTVQELTGVITEYIRFKTDTDPTNIHLFSQSSQYNRSRIRIKESGFYKIIVNGEFYNLNTENVSMYIEKDAYNLFTIKDGFDDQQSAIGFESKLYLRAGEELFVKIESKPNENESHYSYNIAFDLWLDNSVKSVNFSSYLSKIKQKDFIKDILNYYGLIYRRKGDTYELMSLEELLDPLAQYLDYDPYSTGAVADDWSNKFHRVLSNDSKVGNYARNNYFKYKYDNSENTFADSSIRIDDDTLDADKTVVQRPYRAPDISTLASGLRRCGFYSKEYNDDGSLKSVKSNKLDPYFFKVVNSTKRFDYKLAGAEGKNTYTGTYPLMSFEDLDFNNVLPNRYAALSNTLNYGEKITAEMFLTVLDIHTLDFFKLKYIKQLGRMYYLNKVVSFTGTGLTKVELIKVRTLEKLGQFSDDFSDDFNN